MSSQKTAPLFIITSNILNSRPPPPIVTLMLGKNDRQAIKDLNWAQSSRGYDGRVLGRGFREHLGHLWGKSPWVIFGGGAAALNNVHTVCEKHVFSWWKIQRHADGASTYWSAGRDSERGEHKTSTGLKQRDEGAVCLFMLKIPHEYRNIWWVLWVNKESEVRASNDSQSYGGPGKPILKWYHLKKKSNWWTHSSNWILIFIERLKRPSIKSFNFRAALINIFFYILQWIKCVKPTEFQPAGSLGSVICF